MPEEQIDQRNFGATVMGGLLGGAAVGYLLSSGLEDFLGILSLDPPFDHMKPIVAGIGAAAMSAFVIIHYYNTDKHAGALVIERTDRDTPEQPYVRPVLGLKGIARSIETLTEGLHNTELATYAYGMIAERLRRDLFQNARDAFEQNRSGFLADMLDVFTSFQYDGRTIDPKVALERFFKTGDALYMQAVEGIADTLEQQVTQGSFTIGVPSEEVKELLTQELRHAKDVALWAAYLSDRGGIVGAKVRKKLLEFGVTEPAYLPHDVDMLGKNILRLYTRTEQ